MAVRARRCPGLRPALPAAARSAGRCGWLRWLGGCGRCGRLGRLVACIVESPCRLNERDPLRVAQPAHPCYRPPFLGRARVAELVDALDLGSSIERCGGSIPSARTMPRTAVGDSSTASAQQNLSGFEHVTIKTVETENEGLKRAFMLTIPAKDIEARVEQEVKRIAPQIRMPGFRPGKVPPNLIRKMHGDSLQRRRAQRRGPGRRPAAAQREEHPPGAAAAGRARRGIRARQGRRGPCQPRGAARRPGADDRRARSSSA